MSPPTRSVLEIPSSRRPPRHAAPRSTSRKPEHSAAESPAPGSAAVKPSLPASFGAPGLPHAVRPAHLGQGMRAFECLVRTLAKSSRSTSGRPRSIVFQVCSLNPSLLGEDLQRVLSQRNSPRPPGANANASSEGCQAAGIKEIASKKSLYCFSAPKLFLTCHTGRVAQSPSEYV